MGEMWNFGGLKQTILQRQDRRNALPKGLKAGILAGPTKGTVARGWDCES